MTQSADTAPSTLAAATPATTPQPLWRRFLAMLGPMILTNILQAASGTINLVWVGQMVGARAVAIVASVFPLILLLFPVIVGISSGTGVLIGQAFGAKDMKRVRAAAANALVMTIVFGALASIMAVWQTPNLLRLLNVPQTLMPDAIVYTRLFMAGMPALFVLWFVTMIARAVGDAITPLWTLALAAAISLATTPTILLSWHLGLPRAGVSAAALGADISFVAAPLWLAWHWRRKSHILAPAHPRHLTLDFSLWRDILRIGIPTAGQMVAIAFAEMAILTLVDKHGPQALAAYGAVNQLLAWVQFPIMSLGITTTIFASHMIGAGQRTGVPAIVRTGLWLNLAVTGSVIICGYLAGPLILSVFLTDPTTHASAVHLMNIVLWSLLPFGLATILSSALRADKIVLIPTLLAIAAIALIEVPLAITLNTRMGLVGIWYGYAAGYASALVLQTAYYLWHTRGRARST